MVGGVAGEHVGQAGFDTDTAQCQLASGLPRLGLGELVVTELDVGQLEWLLRMPVRQAHRGVQIARSGGEGAVEDRHHESRIDHVEHVGDAVGSAGLGDRVGVGGVEGDPGEAVVADPGHQVRRPRAVVVGDQIAVKEIPAGGDQGGRGADATGADLKNAHRLILSGARIRAWRRRRSPTQLQCPPPTQLQCPPPTHPCTGWSPRA